MGTWRRKLSNREAGPESSPPTSPEPRSEVEARAAQVVDKFSVESLQRIFGDLPGGDRLAQYLQRKARRELAKLSEERLLQYLTFLELIMRSVRTGEQFDQVLAAASAPPEPAEEPAA